MTLTLNPGFVLLAAALVLWACPRPAQAWVMLSAALAAIALPFAPPFGDHNAFGQLGLTVVPLRLDAHSQLFGLLFGMAIALLALAGLEQDRREENVALSVLAGGALTAVYSGDLITMVTGLELAAFGAAGLVFAARGAAAARVGRRMLVWQALSGAFLVAGVGALLATVGDVRFDRIGADTLGGGLILVGLLIRAGAPLAHVALTTGISEASVRGGAGLAVIGALLPVSVLLRGYPGEPAVMGVGIILTVAPLAFIAAQDDARAAIAYGVLVWIGVLMTGVGIGVPLAISGVAVAAFAGALGLLTTMLALAGAVRLAGDARLSRLGGLARRAPVTTALGAVGALSLLGLPGLVGHAGMSVVRDALVRQADIPILIALLSAMIAPALHLGMRIPARAAFGPAPQSPGAGPQFGETLALAVAAFLCVAIGVSPGWLYALAPPSPIAHNPFTWESVLPQLQTVAMAFTVVAAAAALNLAPKPRSPRTQDLDALYASAGRRLERGVLSLQADLAHVGSAIQSRATTLAGAAWRQVQLRLDQSPKWEASARTWAVLIIPAVFGMFYAVALASR